MNHWTPRVAVLTVPGRPNAPLIRRRLSEALEGRTLPVERIEVDPDEASRHGMTGSPTFLLDGAEPTRRRG